MTRVLLASVARILDLGPNVGAISLDGRFGLRAVSRMDWASTDYVVGRIVPGSPLKVPFELPNGRLAEVGEGDLVVGALGRRAATLEAVGDWRAISQDFLFEALTAGGLFGRLSSKSDLIEDLPQLAYEGHLTLDGRTLRMADFVPEPPPARFELPVVLVIGSSMSSGKTHSARVAVRWLRRSGRRVAAAKLTGAGRYRDVLSMGDVGAEWIFDFVDAGMPSTVCEPEEYRAALAGLLARVAALPADVAVIEAGASPLEPYNGAVAVEMLAPHVRFTVLCASDPYAVVGVVHAFERRPDLVAGIAANTEASISLVERLSGLRAMDLRNPVNAEEFGHMLEGVLPALEPRS